MHSFTLLTRIPFLFDVPSDKLCIGSPRSASDSALDAVCSSGTVGNDCVSGAVGLGNTPTQSAAEKGNSAAEAAAAAANRDNQQHRASVEGATGRPIGATRMFERGLNPTTNVVEPQVMDFDPAGMYSIASPLA